MFTALLCAFAVATASAESTAARTFDTHKIVEMQHEQMNILKEIVAKAPRVHDDESARKLRLASRDFTDFHIGTLIFPPGSSCGDGESPMIVNDVPYIRSEQCSNRGSMISCTVNEDGTVAGEVGLFNTDDCSGEIVGTVHVDNLGFPAPCTDIGGPRMTAFCSPGSKRPFIGAPGLMVESYGNKDNCRERHNPESVQTILQGMCQGGMMITGCHKKDLQVAIFDNPACEGAPVQIQEEKIEKSSRYIKRECKVDPDRELDRCGK